MMMNFGFLLWFLEHVDDQLAFVLRCWDGKDVPIFLKSQQQLPTCWGFPNLIQLYPVEYRVPGVVFWATLCCSSPLILPEQLHPFEDLKFYTQICQGTLSSRTFGLVSQQSLILLLQGGVGSRSYNDKNVNCGDFQLLVHEDDGVGYNCLYYHIWYICIISFHPSHLDYIFMQV